MIVVIPLVDGFTALDAIGPYEVLSRLPESRVVFAAVSAGPVQAETKMLSIVAEAALTEIPEPDIVCVPGGLGTRRHLDDPELMRWLSKAHDSSTWTTSVCTGALLLGGAGALEGKRATTHWLELPRLGEFGAIATDQRVVFDGKVVTAAGVSAGLDMALELVRQDRRRRLGEDRAADDRVRPPAAVRLGFLAEGGSAGRQGPAGLRGSRPARRRTARGLSRP